MAYEQLSLNIPISDKQPIPDSLIDVKTDAQRAAEDREDDARDRRLQNPGLVLPRLKVSAVGGEIHPTQSYAVPEELDVSSGETPFTRKPGVHIAYLKESRRALGIIEDRPDHS